MIAIFNFFSGLDIMLTPESTVKFQKVKGINFFWNFENIEMSEAWKKEKAKWLSLFTQQSETEIPTKMSGGKTKV